MPGVPPTRGSLCLVHVAAVDTLAAKAEAAGERWLTAGEQSRLIAIGTPLRRRQYLAGHWLLRELAAERLGGAPEHWRFDIDADPRPRLSRDDGAMLWASLSHSGDRVAAAVGTQAIGLDIEMPRRPRDLVALANFLFAPDEVAQVVAATDDVARARIFYTFWTLKEARGKRGGEGLQPSQARRVCAIASGQPDAEALHWPMPGGGAMAIAAWPGVEVEVQGLGHAHASTHWRYVST